MRIVAAISAYVAHRDPLARAGNVVALTVAASQPFYPVYVSALVGHAVVPALLTLLSTPIFLAVPLLARRSSRAGRVLLTLAGMANTVLGTWILGQSSGVELFLMPCLLIAAALFRPSERLVAIGLGSVALAIFLGLDGRYGPPLCALTAIDQTALVGLHGLSAGTLIVFIGLLSRDSRSSPRPP